MLRTATRIALLSSLLLLLASYSPAQESGNEFHWKGTLPADQTLTIKDVSGTIEATGVDGNQIEVDAEKSGEDADEVHFEVVPGGDGVVICAVFSGRHSSTSCDSGRGVHGSSDNVHARADFRIKVPKNLRFNAYNVNGSVDAQSLGRPVEASSVNGKVDVSTASYARADSVNGSVHVRMGAADWQDTLAIKTVNGSIEMEMPANLAAEVSFRSVNGGLTSDFPITTTEISGRWGPKRINGTIGNAANGRRLDVETVNGSVTIRQETM